jgi:hypothetical protein
VTRDLVAWHRQYDAPSAPLLDRLAVVQREIAAALHDAPTGPIDVIRDGRDLLDVLDEHPRAVDVRARLVELEPSLVDAAKRRAASSVDARCGDAGLTDAYLGITPAQVVLMCGVFGNITDADVQRTISYLPSLTAPQGVVIWTRHRREPDLTPAIRAWLASHRFVEQRFEAANEPDRWSVGVHRLNSESTPLPRGERMFQFVAGSV